MQVWKDVPEQKSNASIQYEEQMVGNNIRELKDLKVLGS